MYDPASCVLMTRPTMLTLRLRLKRALLGVICGAMLFAQHIAVAHAVWHAYQQLPAQQDAFESNRPDRPSAPELSKLCAFDAAFSQVLGAAPPATYSFTANAGCSESAAREPRAFAAADLPRPRSRGPPSFL
jgi:hypothetical protein